MAGVLNDWICDCGATKRNVVLPSGTAPLHCDKPMLTCWDHGQPPATDIHEPVYSHATGEYHRSNRETETRLAEQARLWSDKNGMKWEPPIAAGDRVGGARDENAARGTIASYAGQVSRRGRSGRPERSATAAPPPPTSPSLDQYEVNGIKPRRMTAEEAMRDRKSSVIVEARS